MLQALFTSRFCAGQVNRIVTAGHRASQRHNFVVEDLPRTCLSQTYLSHIQLTHVVPQWLHICSSWAVCMPGRFRAMGPVRTRFGRWGPCDGALAAGWRRRRQRIGNV